MDDLDNLTNNFVYLLSMISLKQKKIFFFFYKKYIKNYLITFRKILKPYINRLTKYIKRQNDSLNFANGLRHDLRLAEPRIPIDRPIGWAI
jgi:hypothetical protein